MDNWLTDIKKYVTNVDEAAVSGIIRHCGIALRTEGASLVSLNDPAETNLVRESFLKRKLGLTDSDETLDRAIAAVGGQMQGGPDQNRVTIYYLLAQRFAKLHLFGGALPGAAVATSAATGAAAGAAGLATLDNSSTAGQSNNGSTIPVATVVSTAGTTGAATGTGTAAATGTTSAAAGTAGVAGLAALSNSSTGGANNGSASNTTPAKSSCRSGCCRWWAWLLLLALILAALLLLRCCHGCCHKTQVGDVAASSAMTTAPDTSSDDEAMTRPDTSADASSNATNNNAANNTATANADATTAIPEGAGAIAGTRNNMPMVTTYFASSKAEVADNFATEAARLEKYAIDHPNMKLIISGFSDPSGSLEFNAELAKKRAHAVADALKAAGVPEAMIVLKKPEDIIISDTTKAKARRVEVTIEQ